MSIVFLRRPQLGNGIGRSTLYERISNGLWTRPVKLGARASAWPAHEVFALNAARIAGKPDDEIRDLVKRLEADRQGACRAGIVTATPQTKAARVAPKSGVAK